jgi:hypothetical protein
MTYVLAVAVGLLVSATTLAVGYLVAELWTSNLGRPASAWFTFLAVLYLAATTVALLSMFD